MEIILKHGVIFNTKIYKKYNNMSIDFINNKFNNHKNKKVLSKIILKIVENCNNLSMQQNKTTKYKNSDVEKLNFICINFPRRIEGKIYLFFYSKLFFIIPFFFASVRCIENFSTFNVPKSLMYIQSIILCMYWHTKEP